MNKSARSIQVMDAELSESSAFLATRIGKEIALELSEANVLPAGVSISDNLTLRHLVMAVVDKFVYRFRVSKLKLNGPTLGGWSEKASLDDSVVDAVFVKYSLEVAMPCIPNLEEISKHIVAAYLERGYMIS